MLFFCGVLIGKDGRKKYSSGSVMHLYVLMFSFEVGFVLLKLGCLISIEEILLITPWSFSFTSSNSANSSISDVWLNMLSFLFFSDSYWLRYWSVEHCVLFSPRSFQIFKSINCSFIFCCSVIFEFELLSSLRSFAFSVTFFISLFSLKTFNIKLTVHT